MARERAFRFDGSWTDYAPIAFTNLLLTIVTLGIYRFWATTRTRDYLWSRTIFIDERLEWTGTGKELLIGFLMVFVIILLPFFCFQFAIQALVIRGYEVIGGVLSIVAFLILFYLGGLARYRALRYRLSRTWWHGIRGGSNDQGWSYGVSYMWKTAAGIAVLGLLVPWSMMSLWNERWSKLSFGPHTFEADGDYRPVFKRYLLFYLLPFIIAGFFFWAAFMLGSSMQGGVPQLSPGLFLGIAALVIGFYLVLGIIALAFYSKFFREAIDGLSLHTLDFHFQARTKDWFLLVLGDAALVIFTLGIGSIFLSYRHWKFFVTHLNASGEISLSDFTQSTTREPRQGEGLLDALDIGAI